MKIITRKTAYIALVVSCLGLAAFIFVNAAHKSDIPTLKERQGALAKAPEWVKTQEEAAQLQSRLQEKPEDNKSRLKLAQLFMQEARATGDFTYYNASAMQLIGEVLKKEPGNFEATCFKAMIYLSQHRFAEGCEVALRAKEINPNNAFVYGLLVDANVELGNYTEAVKMADQMAAIRPDIRSYSRVSYLREIYGDQEGAQKAIQMAISAGYPGYEDTEWARMVSAHLHEDSNQLQAAENAYRVSLSIRPDYPFALAGLGRMARYKKDYPAAIRYLQQARDLMSDAAFLEELMELYQLNGDEKQAKASANITLKGLLSDNEQARKDPETGHFCDKEIAELYLKMEEPAKALPHALAEYQRRPANIDAAETLAWAYYKNGKYAEALPLVVKNLVTGNKNPERLVRSGLILVANGQKMQGLKLIQEGRALKPYMNEALAAAADKVLRS